MSTKHGFWYEMRLGFFVMAVVVGIGGIIAILSSAIASDEISRNETYEKRHATATLDLCAVTLPITDGRLLKTSGRVMYWMDCPEGGIDIYLVRDLLEGRGRCSMHAYLPPTIPETTWRPEPGEVVTLCGLMTRSNAQARMTAAWRCL